MRTPWTDIATLAASFEIDWPRDPAANPTAWGLHLADPAPYNVLRGPVHARGPAGGVVLHRGQEVAAWGEPDRADLTFSVAKTYLALLAGVAHDRGLLPDVDEPVHLRVPGIGFDEGRNARVVWRHLLQQTSEWEGTCVGIPDTVDRYRTIAHAPVVEAGRKGDARPLHEPGTFWEYNDVRINQLSLALLHLFKQPLPQAFEQAIMRPLGASRTWRWVGYDDALVSVTDASGLPRNVPTVPGGTHWGGGVSISARDQAKVGQLMLQRGRWGDAGQGRALVSNAWMERMTRPCDLAPWYGTLLWLNAGPRPVFPAVSRGSFFALGAGGHLTCMDPARDLVVVLRWVRQERMNEVLAAIVSV